MFPEIETPGVKFNSPPEKLIPDIKTSIEKALAQLPEGHNLAVVGVWTGPSYNAAIVAKVDDNISIKAWIGKEWPKDKPNYGVEVFGSWNI